MTQEQEYSRDKLKVLAFKERVSTLTTEYEEKIAELRIDLTISEENNRQLQLRVAELEKDDNDVEEEKN